MAKRTDTLSTKVSKSQSNNPYIVATGNPAGLANRVSRNKCRY